MRNFNGMFIGLTVTRALMATLCTVALCIASVIAVSSHASGATYTATDNDHVWNGTSSSSICALCYSAEYTIAWAGIYAEPTTLSVTTMNMDPYYGSDPGQVSFGISTGAPLSYLGYWFAGSDVSNFLNGTSSAQLMYTFANGS